MLTRSAQHAASHNESRKSLPAILTRSRKRKSNVLQEEEMLNRISNAATSVGRTRHSLSGSLHPFANLFPPSGGSSHSHQQRRHSSRRQSSHNSSECSGGGVGGSSRSSSRDYRRRLLEHDYETRSTTSSSSSGFSYSTRRSSKRTNSDTESLISCLSIGSVSSKSNVSIKNGSSSSGLRGNRENLENNEKSTRSCPFPPVCFANCDEIWELMCKMDAKYKRSPDVFKNHPILSQPMRSILLDWIMDVCEAYKLHRETLYLAIDYLDRYLAVQKNVLKNHLQLVGITCLFVASKLEEIYPPKLKTFAYVTDGACSEEEILDMELVLMKTLKWKLTPITPATWVNVYLQILSYRSGGIYCTRSGTDFLRTSLRLDRDNKPDDSRLVKHIYDSIDFVKVLRLVDLAILDAQSLHFTYSTLAAAAIYHTKGRSAAILASGFSWGMLGPCVNWMAPFAVVLRRHELPPVLPSIEDVSDENRHLIQSLCITLEMLDDAESLRTNKICSPLNHTEGLLTPPNSGEKYRKVKPSPRF